MAIYHVHSERKLKCDVCKNEGKSPMLLKLPSQTVETTVAVLDVLLLFIILRMILDPREKILFQHLPALSYNSLPTGHVC
jgi:hypothetical protein